MELDDSRLRGVKLVGLSGFARCGKDTFGSMLSQWKGWETYALASPIKQHMNELFGWNERHADGDLKEVVDEFWGVSPRYVYQKFGTEFARDLIRDDFWLIRADMVRQKTKQGALIITDVRFENEADWIRKNGGIVVHIVRDDIKDSVLAHASEAGIDKKPQDVVLFNNSTLKEFEKKAIALASSL